MAKKKAKKAPVRRRKSRRSISGVDTNFVQMLVAGGIGYIAGNFVDKVIPIDNPTLKNGGKVVAAYLVPKVIKGPIGMGLAIGLAANGISKTAIGFMPSLGAADDVVMIQGINTIGDDEPLSLNGVPSIGAPGTIGSIEEYLTASGVVG